MYLGIDTHKRYSQVAVINSAGLPLAIPLCGKSHRRKQVRGARL